MVDHCTCKLVSPAKSIHLLVTTAAGVTLPERNFPIDPTPPLAFKPDDSRTDLAFGKYLLHVLRMMLSDFLPHTCGTMLLVRELVYYLHTNFCFGLDLLIR